MLTLIGFIMVAILAIGIIANKDLKVAITNQSNGEQYDVTKYAKAVVVLLMLFIVF